MSTYFFRVCVAFARTGLLIKIVHLLYYLTIYVSKLPRGTHFKSSWKLIPKYADCDVQKRMSNCCLSVKYTSLVAICQAKSNLQYYHSHYYYHLWHIGKARSAREVAVRLHHFWFGA
jgi:hypothetical protein